MTLQYILIFLDNYLFTKIGPVHHLATVKDHYTKFLQNRPQILTIHFVIHTCGVLVTDNEYKLVPEIYRG